MKIMIPFLFSGGLLLSSFSAQACSTKSCEAAYLNSSQQYVELQGQRALAAQRERVAYAKVREERQKKMNEHLIREARNNIFRIIHKAVSEGKSMSYIAGVLKEAYATGSIKAEPIRLQELMALSDEG